MKLKKRICIVIPCYKVSNNIIDVINSKFLKRVHKIVIVDDDCPEHTGKKVNQVFRNNPKIKVLKHKINKGVGGATITGFKYALKNKFDIVIKVDGDGQHNLQILKSLISALSNKYEFCKGYRKLNFNSFLKHNMPIVRLLGAIGLTFLTRVNTGDHEIKDACMD